MAAAGAPDRRALLRMAAERLRATGAEDPEGEAETVLCAALGLSRSALWREPGAVPSAKERRRLEDWLARYAAGEPLAHLEGRVGFHGLELQVDARVLVPRPDSEAVVELAAAQCAARPPRRIVDVGTGSGCLLLALLDVFPDACGEGVDVSADALEVARANAERLGMGARAAWRRGSWLAPVAEGDVDLIVSNPPYVVPGEELGPGIAEHEPHVALFTPPDDPTWAYRALLAEAPRVLARHGALVVEVGAGRAQEVARLGSDAGWTVRATARDLGGVERAVALAPPR